ncbi:Glycosyltransferase involved in cell wall bisynthesis [Jannaschia faecimaris]|uniref:Glycosyltransferase involved in cell wall bisynthesis n=1 Tax=Jannaschia faecimaris TaxID=1244108 RepID=A0A1H3JCF6_9RHOB|nr:glycosyltransferase family 4 protein [Jannaschia faecimaris]SDY37098.1 Glycosyltransferase involved in cell wall bisynthesis [Jannaschia faecimaris]
MKVLMIGSEPADYAIAFANGVAAHGPLTLVLPRARFADLRDSLDPKIDLHLMDWPRHRSLTNPAFLWRLTRLIRREEPDIIHLLSNTALWLNAALPFWRPVPLLTTVHDARLHPGDRDTATLPAWSPRLIVRQSDDIVVHGEGLRQQALEAFSLPPDRLHVLPHPAMPRYAELARARGLRPRPRGKFNVLMFGRIFAYKGLDLLMQAEALIGDDVPDLSIVIAGRGDDPHDLSQMMGQSARYDIRHRFIPDAEVAQLFLDADMVVLPYREASQSGVLPVAATFGKPVVVTDVGELRATVEPNDMGLVVPPDDPGALAAAIVRMARDDALRARCGEAAQEWAERVVAPPIVGAEARRLYARIVQTA